LYKVKKLFNNDNQKSITFPEIIDILKYCRKNNNLIKIVENVDIPARPAGGCQHDVFFFMIFRSN